MLSVYGGMNWFCQIKKRWMKCWGGWKKRPFPTPQLPTASFSATLLKTASCLPHRSGKACLTSAILPAGGTATIELPQENEDLFVYFVDGNGRFQSSTTSEAIDLYDVMLATPEAETAVIHAGDQPLNYLSLYLKPFMGKSCNIIK
jgi:hypothetical protein